MMPLPQRPPAVKYKKPSALNGVTFLLLALLAVAGYVAFSFWPAFALKSRVKGELQDAVVQLYRANLRPEPIATQQTLAMKRALLDSLRRAGVADKRLEVQVTRTKQLVALEARFATEVELKGIGKRFTLHHAPRVQTDSARVEW